MSYSVTNYKFIKEVSVSFNNKMEITHRFEINTKLECLQAYIEHVSAEERRAAKSLAFWWSLIFILHNSKLLVQNMRFRRRDRTIYQVYFFSLNILQSQVISPSL